MFKKIITKISPLEYFFFSILALFSTWLMWSTFAYRNGSMYIASKAWSDFASHIPLIRSFSLGSNFPPQYPIFPGEPIKYHFLFYFFVAMLEKIGIRLDFALNIPSALGFFFLLIMIYFFAKKIFSSIVVGTLSIIFFLFNGSFSFLEFFRQHPFGMHTLSDILSNKTFSSFGPYDGKIVSAFWNLNIYTNQRHLALSYGVALGLIYLALFVVQRKKYCIVLGTILGFSFLLNMAVFIMSIVVFAGIFLFFPKQRIIAGIILTISGIIAFPQYIYTHTGGVSFLSFHLGYLTQAPVTIFSFLWYWLFNLGLHTFLIPIGFFLCPKPAKKIFLCVLPLFIIGNLFQFSPEVAANHKFFNFFMIFGVMLSAYALVLFWKKWNVAKPLVIILTLLLIFSGIIDFFPIFNDYQIGLTDYPTNPDVAWIKNNTPKDAVFFNTQYLYDTASLAGRKIFLGWPYFSWSQGYDTTRRSNEIKQILSDTALGDTCLYFFTHSTSYIELTKPSEDFPYNPSFWKKFHAVYTSSTISYTIYKVQDVCLNLKSISSL